jgi:hypothetical protein
MQLQTFMTTNQIAKLRIRIPKKKVKLLLFAETNCSWAGHVVYSERSASSEDEDEAGKLQITTVTAIIEQKIEWD